MSEQIGSDWFVSDCVGSCRVVPGRVGSSWVVLYQDGSYRVVSGRVGLCCVVSRWTDPRSRSPDPPESIRIRLGQKGQIFTYVCLY